MSNLKTWHTVVGSLLGLAWLAMLITDDWSWFLLVSSTALTAFLGGNFLFAWRNRARVAESALWDLSPFHEHQDFSLAAAQELWQDEAPGSTLELAVKLRGRAKASGADPAPLSGRGAAWRLMVDGFKTTRLGGEGDLVSLADRTSFPTLTLIDGPDQALVEGPGLLNLGNLREEATTWSGLKRFGRAMGWAEEGLVLQGLKPDAVPGVRVRETRLDDGEVVTAYGLLSRGSEGFVLRGNDHPGDVKSLLVIADKASDKLRRHRRGTWAFGANLVLLVASLPWLGWAVYASPGFFPRHQGPVWVNLKGQNIDVAASEPAGTNHFWSFDDSDRRTDVALQSGDADWSADGDQVITVTRIVGTPVDYAFDQAHRLAFVDGHWPLDPSHPWTPGVRKGPLWFHNPTARTITLQFPDTATVAQYNWSLKPHEGSSGQGNQIVVDDKPFDLAEGQSAVLEVKEVVVRRLVFGQSPELKWDTATSTWNLTLTEAVLKTPSPVLWAVPLADKHLRGVLVEPRNGQAVTFDLPPETGGAARAVRSVVDDAYEVDEGQTLRVTTADETVLYHGALRDCPFVTWTKDHWSLKP